MAAFGKQTFPNIWPPNWGNAEDLIGYEPDPLSYNLKDPICRSPPEEDKKRRKQRRKRSGRAGQFKKLGIMFISELIPSRGKHYQVLTLNGFPRPPCLTRHASPEQMSQLVTGHAKPRTAIVQGRATD